MLIYFSPSALVVFQFHKGAIRTVLLFHNPCLIFRFNSIKVRLELIVMSLRNS